MSISFGNLSAFIRDHLDDYTYDPATQTMTEVGDMFLKDHPEVLKNFTYSSFQRSFRAQLNERIIDKEIREESIKTSKKLQKQKDLNRIERKAFREHARLENAVEAIASDMIKIYREYGSRLIDNVKTFPKVTKPTKKDAVGIMQFTDIHANELIQLPHNRYDFDVLASRLRHYVHDCIDWFKNMGVKRVICAFTGDLVNSDRRLDEKLNQSTNRAKAALLTQNLLLQALLEIRQQGFFIDVVSVLGNESRITEELGFSNEVASENYDLIVIGGVKNIIEFSKAKGINFLSIDKMEVILKIQDQNWLVTHDIAKVTSSQQKTQSTIGRYYLQGTPIDFIIAGHIHISHTHGFAARAGSLSGSNSYNENALSLFNRAGANAYVVKDGRRFVQIMDYQDSHVNKYPGYKVEQDLKVYNAKSAQKIKPQQKILEIVI